MQFQLSLRLNWVNTAELIWVLYAQVAHTLSNDGRLRAFLETIPTSFILSVSRGDCTTVMGRFKGPVWLF